MPTDNHPCILAVFDFDHTLIKGDSLWPFLIAAVGRPAAFIALLEAIVSFLKRSLSDRSDPPIADYRSFIKAQLLHKVLAGKPLLELNAAIAKTRSWQQWNEPIRQKLLDHAAQNHHIVIISGALDLYLPALTKELPPHQLICTKMEVRDGIVTGAMPEGNCVRVKKAQMLALYLTEKGPFINSFGYGNSPHDVPMLALLQHRMIV